MGVRIAKYRRLYQPTDAKKWNAFFSGLLGDRASTANGAWLALSLKGRSVGSGIGFPILDELLGTSLPPLRALSPDEPAQQGGPAEQELLQAQATLCALMRWPRPLLSSLKTHLLAALEQ